MYRFMVMTVVGALLLGSTATAQTRVGGGSLQALEGTSTLVTVVLKSTLARDVNLTVSSVENSIVRFTDERGTSVVYKLSDIAEVRLQSERIDDSGFSFSSPLQREDVAGAIKKASERAAGVLANNEGPPLIRIMALEIGASIGSSDAIASLERFALSDDIAVAVDAYRALRVIGRNPDTEVLKLGLRASDRNVKGKSAALAGLAGVESLRDQVVEMVKDPAPEVFAGAAEGCGYYRDERAIPFLLRSLNTTTKQKGDAAVLALAGIGGENVRREMYTRVQTASGAEWYNAVRVLYLMGEPRGIDLLRGELRSNSPYAIQTALMLANDDYWDANVYLRKFLESKTDTSVEAYEQRIEAAAILLSKGYVQAKAHLRDVFAMDPSTIYIRGQLNNEAAHLFAHASLKATTCIALAIHGDLSMLPMLLTAVDDQNPIVALLAARAIVAIANPDYRSRISSTT